jgi:hypothetical protein
MRKKNIFKKTKKKKEDFRAKKGGICEYAYILRALPKIYSGTQERSKWTRGDSTYAAGY